MHGHHYALVEIDGLEPESVLPYRVEIDGSPEKIDGMAVTGSFFSVIRVSPAAGRPFTEADETPGQNDKLVLTAGLATELLDAQGLRLQRAGILPQGWTVVPGAGMPLDAYGNSVRGQLAARFLSQRLGLTLFASAPA